MRIWQFSMAVVMGLALTASTACDKNGKFNLLSVEQDRQLGAQTAQQIASDPGQFPLLPRQGNEQAYAYLDNMRSQILNSGKITYKDEFAWEMHIIRDDATLNAFCTPGGYIYVYTGLIKFLDRADDLAGVLGHEMGHADLRHTSRQITQQQGYDLVLSIALGQNPGALAQIATQLKDLTYSRSYEREADDASVKYLSATSYACNGAASFFQKLIDRGDGGQGVPTFLSTHPAPASRVQDINAEAQTLGCSTTPTTDGGYAAFKRALP